MSPRRRLSRFGRREYFWHFQLAPKAVDIAPQRRLDTALRNICQGALNASYKNKKSIESCLADEIIKASKNDPASFSIAKKNDVERIARSAR